MEVVFSLALLWKIDHRYSSLLNLPRPVAYQGRLWSWLAANGPVRFARVQRPEECVAEILSVDAEPVNLMAPFGLVQPNSGRLVPCAHVVPGMRYRVPLRAPNKYRDEAHMIGVKRPAACFATATLDCDVEGEDINEDEEKAGCLLVETLRSGQREEPLSQGLALRWSSPDRTTYSRIGRFSYQGEKKHVFSVSS